MSTAPHPVTGTVRLAALDGLRGVAALVVVVFHYLCLLHWHAVPVFSPDPPAIADTPLGLLWNGPFAVSVFFVLSGFVMAAAAHRRRAALLANAATRYLRLAIPVTASVLLAWALLAAMPDVSLRLAASEADPSPWLEFTHAGEIPGLHLALADGMLGNFLQGGSDFNNVLWTMQIELLGSLMLFAIYWLASGAWRLWLLLGAAIVIFLLFSNHYLGFIAGAGLYEMARRGWLDPDPDLRWRAALLPALALLLGVVLGAPSMGAHERLGLPHLPGLLRLGAPWSLWPVVAATLILYAALTLRPLGRLLSARLPQWLGRVSFGLYLVHVPPLYTLVAAAHLAGTLPAAVLGALYFAGVLLAAHLFTLAVDEPGQRGLRRLREWMVAPGARAEGAAGMPGTRLSDGGRRHAR